MLINIFLFSPVSRLMGGSNMNMNMGNVTSLSTCSMADNKAMQFPLSQRRKRRVLFTQAQVSSWNHDVWMHEIFENYYSLREYIICNLKEKIYLKKIAPTVKEKNIVSWGNAEKDSFPCQSLLHPFGSRYTKTPFILNTSHHHYFTL